MSKSQTSTTSRPTGQTAGVFTQHFTEEQREKRPMSVTINKPIGEVALLLRNLNNFPLFLENLEKVESLSDDRAKWYFRTSGSNAGDSMNSLAIPMAVAWGQADSGMVWKAEDGAGFFYTVAIELSPAQANRGTVARMMVAYDDSMGKVAGVFEKLFGQDAEILSKKNLQRFQAFCETGHVPTIEGQSSGRDEDQLDSTKH